MKRSKEIFGFDDTWLMLIGIPLTAFLTTAMMFGDLLVRNPFFFFTGCGGVGLIYTTVYWVVFRQVVLYFGQKYPESKDLGRRIFVQSIIVLAIFFLIQALLDPILHSTIDQVVDNQLRHGIGMTIGSLLITFMVLGIYITTGFYHQLRKTQVEKEQLLKENMQSQLESLKSQVNPHFFFNSLNTLAYLIPEDADKAVNFVQKLSKAYRYILEIRDRQWVALREELDFLDSYNCLLKERFGSNLAVRLDVPDRLLDSQVVPLSLQMLFENAIKHNIVSSQHPLLIEVFVEKDDWLVVRNNFQPKKQEMPSTKLGLENIRKRYQLVSNQEVGIQATEAFFTVVLPLSKSKLAA